MDWLRLADSVARAFLMSLVSLSKLKCSASSFSSSYLCDEFYSQLYPFSGMYGCYFQLLQVSQFFVDC